MFGVDLLQTIKKYYKNQLDAVRQTGFDKDFVYRATKSENFEIIAFIRKIVEQNNISPEELYELITGNKVEGDSCDNKRKITLPERYIIQTNKHINNLTKRIEELKHLVQYFESALMEALKHREPAPTQTQEPTAPHTIGLIGQHVAKKVTEGKNHHTTTAPP